MPTCRVKVTPRVLDWLDGTGVGQALMSHGVHHPAQVTDEILDSSDDVITAVVIAKVHAAAARKDGSRWPTLTKAEIADLMEYAGFMIGACADDASATSQDGDMEGLADLNAARAQIRRCDVALARLGDVDP